MELIEGSSMLSCGRTNKFQDTLQTLSTFRQCRENMIMQQSDKQKQNIPRKASRMH